MREEGMKRVSSRGKYRRSSAGGWMLILHRNSAECDKTGDDEIRLAGAALE
jgi:hypothetical protein